jgi:hypothetical protein
MNVAEIDPSSGDHVLGRTRDEALQIVDQLVGQNLHGSRTRPGLPERGGSTESTSNPAPPMRPARSASASACSSTRPPRAVLISRQFGFIRASSAAPIRIAVPAVSGTCSEMTSLA